MHETGGMFFVALYATVIVILSTKRVAQAHINSSSHSLKETVNLPDYLDLNHKC